ncbi:putative helicase mov-10-B.1 [Achroia grisella]|uniref:putative helicase mov-10-B.1 n=1 Tax=Achroia grisella TaxID=688607 RepID=UPI0027D326D5|nr:putative helicase mov-10-B.1 [Achroia grisella]
MLCKVCGWVDEYYNEESVVNHRFTPKHVCNLELANFKSSEKYYTSNRKGVYVFCSAHSKPTGDGEESDIWRTDEQNIQIFVKPKQRVQFSFSVANDVNNGSVFVMGALLAHPQPQFEINDHPFVFGEDPVLLQPGTILDGTVVVTFESMDIGHYEMPIIFTFAKESESKNLIIVREMIVKVTENPLSELEKDGITQVQQPALWTSAEHFIRSPLQMTTHQNIFKIPKLLKILLPRDLKNSILDDPEIPSDLIEKLKRVLATTRSIFEEGITRFNYMAYFHHLLWWEESIATQNLKQYTIAKTTISKMNGNDCYLVEVDGLPERSPSVIRGDRILIRPSYNNDVVFECFVKNFTTTEVLLTGFDKSFNGYYTKNTLFDVHFTYSRMPMERMHDAISKVFTTKQACRVFPVPSKIPIPVKTISRFYNNVVRDNEEQRSAVEHIVSGTSGTVPYILVGPPGTGKTMTIVETIVQLVSANPRNRIMVCTHSNMAADHIAVMLLEYNKKMKIDKFILRGNSRCRDWSMMPPVLGPVSNGTSFESFSSLKNETVSYYRIFVTTLTHAAKYATEKSQSIYKLEMTHLFIDEAAQASEPATLVPICGLLSPTGQVVLAGDTRQLGPVCVSYEAKRMGLGKSLMERLKDTHTNIYDNDPNFTSMLIKNYRSDPDILKIPNTLFYEERLQALAKPDPLSSVSILGLPGGNRSIVFHAVQSQEHKIGGKPSYSNEIELNIVMKYVKALIYEHNVQPEDIGIISPYIRQVNRMKTLLECKEYNNIEVGTVESFQGKEKRVILISTVRANCKLLDQDAKYSLGFLVDEKRFNVALTRAKAKLIIIGNPACLTRDEKWRMYMEQCNDYDTYHCRETQQLLRDTNLHMEIMNRLVITGIIHDMNNYTFY